MALDGFQVLRPWIGLKDERGPGQLPKVKGDHRGRGRNAAGRGRLTPLALFPPWPLLRRLWDVLAESNLTCLSEGALRPTGPRCSTDRVQTGPPCADLPSHERWGVLREAEAHAGPQWSFPCASKVQGHDVGAQRWIRHSTGPQETGGLEGAGSPCHTPW